MNLHPLGMPKPMHVSAPKIAHVSVAKINNGVTVQHHMTAGPQPKPFVFDDPRKAMQHIRRIQSSQWREPDRNPATAMNRSLDIQTY